MSNSHHNGLDSENRPGDGRERPVHPQPHVQPPWEPMQPNRVPPGPYKRKWIAGLLAFVIPGTGHLYLGLMQKGLFLMLLLILDIITIVHFAINSTNIPLITLFALFIPVIYFYNLFDALQSTDKVNLAGSIQAHPIQDARPEQPKRDAASSGKLSYTGWLLVGAGVLFFLFSTKPSWLSSMTEHAGTYIGGFVLIAIGLLVYWKDSRPK